MQASSSVFRRLHKRSASHPEELGAAQRAGSGPLTAPAAKRGPDTTVVKRKKLLFVHFRINRVHCRVTYKVNLHSVPNHVLGMLVSRSYGCCAVQCNAMPERVGHAWLARWHVLANGKSALLLVIRVTLKHHSEPLVGLGTASHFGFKAASHIHCQKQSWTPLTVAFVPQLEPTPDGQRTAE